MILSRYLALALVCGVAACASDKLSVDCSLLPDHPLCLALADTRSQDAGGPGDAVPDGSQGRADAASSSDGALDPAGGSSSVPAPDTTAPDSVLSDPAGDAAADAPPGASHDVVAEPGADAVTAADSTVAPDAMAASDAAVGDCPGPAVLQSALACVDFDTGGACVFENDNALAACVSACVIADLGVGPACGDCAGERVVCSHSGQVNCDTKLAQCIADIR